MKARLLGFLCVLLAFPSWGSGAYLRNVPQSLLQPDRTELHCLASGDEFYNWLHDRDGFTIVQDPVTGYYVYALLDASSNLTSSSFIVGRVDPRALGLRPGLKDSPGRRRSLRNAFLRASAQQDSSPAPRMGGINNIVIFIRFAGENEFTDPISTYTAMFNASGAGVNSMFNYFREATYDKLIIGSTFYPTPSTTVVSYQDGQARGYYLPYNAAANPSGYTGGDNGTDRRDREHTLLANAVNGVRAQVPLGLNLDGDGDDCVDNVCFIVSGGPTGWASLLWPHMWALFSKNITLNNKRVYDYNLQLRNSVQSSGVGVLCHEMFHSLGAPDLYHYSDNGISPVWEWDLMGYNCNPPQHMGAYMKFRYGTWIETIPEITASGTYTLNPLTSPTHSCYKIKSHTSATEYYVLEYRRRAAPFESSLPGEGLLVYRINSSVSGLGNDSGPPDEVYLYRPGGTTTAEGSPLYAPFSSTSGRTAINDATDPSGFLSSGALGGLNISNIGTAGSTISFQVNLDPLGTTTLAVSKTSLSFGALAGGGVSTPKQSVMISYAGSGTMNWMAAGSASFIQIAPSQGTGNGVFEVGVGSAGLSAGTYTGSVTVSDSNAANSPRIVGVTLRVYSAGTTSPPFGSCDTPVEGAMVRGSVPVTGWALDEIGLAGVKIYRDPVAGEAPGANGLVYLGDAVFVEGARQDIPSLYPSYPRADMAGWGYMLLTNFLPPNQGNGTYRLHAVATDLAGASAELGTKTIVCDNAHAVKPFGAIDTPIQGGTASGSGYFNFGWALTPRPNSIPADGSTITVWIDGAALGHPLYGNYRADIAAKFPGYANSNGAVGVFALDTTKFAYGVHTIAWSVRDSAGNEDGIGSRFFNILNSGSSPDAAAMDLNPPWIRRAGESRPDVMLSMDMLRVKKGFRPDEKFALLRPDLAGRFRIDIEEGDRLEIALCPAGEYAGGLGADEMSRPLPAGTTFDRERGVLSWIPGPGFLGAFDFVFGGKDPSGRRVKILARVVIKPKKFE